MSSQVYTLREFDLQFLFMVHQRLIEFYNENAASILAKSTLIKLVTESPSCIHHYDEQYWANYVQREYEQKKKEEKAMEKEVTRKIVSQFEEGKSVGEIVQELDLATEVIIPVFNQLDLLKNNEQEFKKYLADMMEEAGTKILQSDDEENRKAMRKVMKDDPLAAAVWKTYIQKEMGEEK